ncbi:hypothetical protein, partial [Proteus mirabilis]
TKITYIFPDYDKKRNYSNKKYSVTEKDRIESIKHTAKVYELTYLKEKKEKEIASLKYYRNKYSIIYKVRCITRNLILYNLSC